MSTSQRTFDQVKSILGKLDRDIDAARARRMQTRAVAQGNAAAAQATPPPQPGSPLPAPPTATPSTPAAPSLASRPAIGRAQPMARPMRPPGHVPLP